MDDAELMRRVQSGDLAAFDELVGRHQETVLNIAYRYVAGRADAEDVAQEVFLRVFRARGRYEPSAKFSTWLFRIAVNYCLNLIKREQRHRAGSDEALGRLAAETEPPEARLERRELADAIREAVDRLPPQQRTALLLNKYDGLDYRGIADTMDLSVMAVKSLLMRARLGLRDQLGRTVKEALEDGAWSSGTA